MRAGNRTTAEAALDAWFLHEWWDDWDTVEAQRATNHVLILLGSLPVEDRMEAMGMRHYGNVTWDDDEERDTVTDPLDVTPGADLYVAEEWVADA